MKTTSPPGMLACPRDPRGRLLPIPALERFASKCAFDPVTGCVMWIGGTSHGRGHNEPYGRFWDDGFMWYAHRWSARHIHGLAIDGLQVDHCCPAGPSTLCVEHVKPETNEVNRLYQHTRPGRGWQDVNTRQYWVLVQKGLVEQYRPRPRVEYGSPWYNPPEWLAPFLPPMEYHYV